MNEMDRERYKRLREPPTTALKQIGGGRLKGFTDINPQWRYRAMNDEFGPCGEGWKYTIDRLWLEPSGEQVAAFAMVSVFVKTSGGWSEPIPAVGGSMFVEMESKGPYTSDECFKMAVTDALGTAMKMLGVGAAIYEGRWDGSKYKTDVPAIVPDIAKVLEGGESAKTIHSLQSWFTASTRLFVNDPDAIARITTLKDRRKQEIQKGPGAMGVSGDVPFEK